jgi:hypothetical protein
MVDLEPTPQLVEAIRNFLEMHLSEGTSKNLVAYYCYKRLDEDKYKFMGYTLEDLQSDKKEGFQQFVEEGIKLRDHRQKLDCLLTLMIVDYYVINEDAILYGLMEFPFTFGTTDPDEVKGLTRHAGALFCYLDLHSDYKVAGVVLFDDSASFDENDNLILLVLSPSRFKNHYDSVIPYTQPLTMIQGLTCGLELEKSF